MVTVSSTPPRSATAAQPPPGPSTTPVSPPPTGSHPSFTRKSAAAMWSGVWANRPWYPAAQARTSSASCRSWDRPRSRPATPTVSSLENTAQVPHRPWRPTLTRSDGHPPSPGAPGLTRPRRRWRWAAARPLPPNKTACMRWSWPSAPASSASTTKPPAAARPRRAATWPRPFWTPAATPRLPNPPC